MNPFRGAGILVLFLSMLVLSTSCSSSKRGKTANRNKTERAKTSDASAVLFAFVEDWKGVPYKYGGTSKSGVDCSGFVGILYQEVYNRNVPRTTGQLSTTSASVSQTKLSEGDLVFFDINGKKNAHVGVYLRNGEFVHASSSKGVVVSSLQNPYYKEAFRRGGKL